MRFWCGYLSGVRCRLFAYGPADATALQIPISSLASFKSRLVLPFWYRLTQRPLNGCSSCYDDRQQRSFILSCESGPAKLQTTRKPANNTSWTKLLVTLYFSHVSLQSVYRRQRSAAVLECQWTWSWVKESSASSDVVPVAVLSAKPPLLLRPYTSDICQNSVTSKSQLKVTIIYQKFIVRPLLRGPRTQVHYKSRPNAKTQRITHKKSDIKSLTKTVWLQQFLELDRIS